MRERHWTAHLRLLPGGDTDVASGLLGSGLVWGAIFCVAGFVVLLVHRRFLWGPILPIAVVAAVPTMVIGLWTGLRVVRSKPIEVEEAAALPRLNRAYFGEQTPRVPSDALVVSIRPRQLPLELADGRRLVLWFRAEEEQRALIALAVALQSRPGLSLEDYVASVAEPLAKELLPDPQRVTEHLRGRFQDEGIVVTKGELR
jgi:hypothetical protein